MGSAIGRHTRTGVVGLCLVAGWGLLGTTEPGVHAGPQAVGEGPTDADLETEFRQVRERLRDLPEFHGADAETHVRLADALAHRGDVNGAAEEYQAAIALQPDMPEAHRGLGVLRLDRHEWAGAAESLRTVVRLRPMDGEAWYWLGRALMGVGDWPGAAAALERATTLRPDDAEAYADVGLVRMVQGDSAGAAEALHAALRLKPDHAEVHRLLETLGAFQKDPREIARAARRMVEMIFARE